MSAPTEVFRQCLAEAVKASGPLLERSLEKAVSSLDEAQAKVSKAEARQELSDAWRELMAQRGGWIARYPQALQLAFDTSGPRAPAPPAPPVSRNTLTLVDEAEVDQQLEAVRLTAQLQSMVDQPLGELDALVSSALGLTAVRRDRNPLRPDVFAQTLRGLMSESEENRKWQALWLRHVAPGMGAELGELYRRLSPLLTRAGVAPVAYRMVTGASGPAPPRPAGTDAKPSGKEAATGVPGSAGGAGSNGGSGGGSGGGQGGASGGAGPAWAGNAAAGREGAAAGPIGDPRLRGSALADLSQGGLGDELVREFLRRDDGQGQAPLAQGYYARVASELAELEAAPPEAPPDADPQAEVRYQQLPVVERPARAVSTSTPLDRAVWGDLGQARERALLRTRLKKQAQKVDQVLGLELVRKLVNQVAADPRLLGPVRESIIALEPALLRLAMVEPRFFSDDKHPGRCLVERVAERSLRFNDEFVDDFKDYAADVAKRFTALNANEEAGVQEFTATLAELESGWSGQDAQDDRDKAQALDKVRFAEKRQAAANEIAQVLAQRPDIGGVPQVVQEFLYGPWSLVMAQARLTDAAGHIDPGGHGSVVTDLLWSVKRESALRQPARLIQLIPGLLQRLRAGLAVLGQTPQDCAAFFDTLERLHRPVLDLRARRRGDPDSTSGPEPEANLPRPVPRQQPKLGDTPWMARRELAAVGFAGGPDSVSGEGPASVLPEGPASVLPPGTPRPTGSPATAAPQAPAAITAARPAPASGPASAMPTFEPLPSEEVASLLAGLQEGSWVDLYAGQRWLRARLAYSSARATLFMFVSQGGQPHSMTRRICERLLRDRLLRPVQMHGVVAHAIGVVGQPSGAPRAVPA